MDESMSRSDMLFALAPDEEDRPGPPPSRQDTLHPPYDCTLTWHNPDCHLIAYPWLDYCQHTGNPRPNTEDCAHDVP